MDANTSKIMVAEAGKVLDALAALKYDIDCHCGHPQRKDLTPQRRLEACAAMRQAIDALKRMLQMPEQDGARLIVLHATHTQVTDAAAKSEHTRRSPI